MWQIGRDTDYGGLGKGMSFHFLAHVYNYLAPQVTRVVRVSAEKSQEFNPVVHVWVVGDSVIKLVRVFPGIKDELGFWDSITIYLYQTILIP